MEKYITILINGEPFNCQCSMSLKQLLLYLNFDFNSIIIEYNHKILVYSQYENIFFSKNDSIEIITIVGGG
uniref:Thiamin biosynthesis protein S n=1 Tax=Halydictyon mirabile TaxID=189652 RepID=A0A4D6WX11_9FLOR|nr:Thiamin biosynthesis protein S [Halydictyon mirabile]